MQEARLVSGEGGDGLTEAGRVNLEQTHAPSSLIGDVERGIQGQEEELSGRVRLSVPTTYGHFRLPLLLQGFAAQFPLVQGELNAINHNVDLVAEGFDLAIRLATLPDRGLVVCKLKDAALRPVSSPEYLSREGPQRSQDYVALHACVPCARRSNGRVPYQCRGRGLAAVHAACGFR